MAEKKKESIEDLVTVAKKSDELKTAWINEFDRGHNMAYEAGMKAIGPDADATSLSKDENQDKMAQGMADYYVERFGKEYGAKPEGKFKDFKREEIINHMSGSTHDMLRKAVKDDKHNYTVKKHRDDRADHIARLEDLHTFTPFSHITMDHRKLIAKAADYKGDVGKLDLNKTKVLFANYFRLVQQEDQVKKGYDKL